MRYLFGKSLLTSEKIETFVNHKNKLLLWNERERERERESLRVAISNSQGPISRVIGARIPCPRVPVPGSQGPVSQGPRSRISGSDFRLCRIIYLKVTIEKNRRSQNFDFLSLKNSSPGQLLGSFNSHISLIFKPCCNLKIRDLGAKLCVWFFYYFNFGRTYDVLRWKNPSILLDKNVKFENGKSHTQFKRDEPCTSADVKIPCWK